MSFRPFLASLMAMALVIGAVGPAAAAPPSRAAADADAFHGRLIVTWSTTPPTSLRMPGVRAVQGTGRPLRTVVQTRAGASADVAARLRNDPRVLAVVPDASFELTDWPADGAPNDPLYPDQADLARIGVPAAWTHTTGDPSVVVAVLDSGVDLTHPDLDGVAIVAPQDVAWNSTDVTDELGHGTHVAGTIVAEADNGEGIAGIAPASTLMPVKVTSNGATSLSDVLDGVDWARQHGADVMNMSFSGRLTPEQVALAQPTFTAARAAGILMVAASGNEGTSARSYPASFAGVVSVSAVDDEDVVAYFSTFGKAVDIAAPGVELLSTALDGEYTRGTGTSMASPHVAAVAALVWAARPSLAVAEVEAVIRASAVDLGAPGKDVSYGDGRVDAAAAMIEPVPDPLPDLDPPLALPALQISFLAPSEDVRQTGSTYLVRLALNHDVTEGYAIRGAWPIEMGRCNFRVAPTTTMLEFALEMQLTGLRRGSCSEVYVVALDEDGNFSEAVSPDIIVYDATIPRIVGRTPARGQTGVDRSSSVRIRFSEAVKAEGIAARVRNLKTGLIVRTTSRWIPSTRTLVLDPVLRMYPRTRYQVEITARVQDRYGNSVRPETWVFTTGR